MSVGVYTSVCSDDACWVPQYLGEMDRLSLHFAVHLDRWEPGTSDVARLLTTHRLCVGYTVQDDYAIEFDETHKQRVFDLIVRRGFSWAMAVDIDETFEKGAAGKLRMIADGAPLASQLQVSWVNLWGDERHIRADGPFLHSWRVKFHRLRSGIRWQFMHKITNGPKPDDNHLPTTAKTDLVCLHWGLMTRALRESHKERWDRIYTAAVGGNPYRLWEYAIDEANYPPTVLENPYL